MWAPSVIFKHGIISEHLSAISFTSEALSEVPPVIPPPAVLLPRADNDVQRSSLADFPDGASTQHSCSSPPLYIFSRKESRDKVSSGRGHLLKSPTPSPVQNLTVRMLFFFFAALHISRGGFLRVSVPQDGVDGSQLVCVDVSVCFLQSAMEKICVWLYPSRFGSTTQMVITQARKENRDALELLF